jgi:hypothetical protein
LVIIIIVGTSLEGGNKKMEQVDYLLFDEAVITSKGILFRDHYYSCPIAVKNQLFHPNHCTEDKRVDVLYEPLTTEKILIKLEEWRLCFAYLITEDTTMSESDVEEYHAKIQIMKSNYKQARKRKIQRVIIREDNSSN